MLLFAKRLLKTHSKRSYRALRTFALSHYSYWRARRLLRFTAPVFYPFSFDGVSFAILLDPVNGFIDQEIAWKGVYEEDTLDLYTTQLHEGDVYVDIGSNIGQHALFASRLVGNSGHVIAFEPIERLYRQFLRSLSENSIANVTPINAACGAETNKNTIFLRPLNAGGASFVPFFETDAGTEIVSVVTADSQLSNQAKIDFVKIDAEGFEYEVLQGLRQTLGNHAPRLLIEYSPIFYKHRCQGPEHNGIMLLKLLADYDYSIVDRDNDMRAIPDPIAWAKTFSKDQTNIYCTR